MTASVQAGRRPGPSIGVGHVALAVPFAAAIIAARLPVRDNSYLWHVRSGTVQSNRTAVLTADPFSFTAAGRPWRTQSWLADLFYDWGDRLWGLDFVVPLILLGSILLVASIAFRVFDAVKSTLFTALGTAWIMWITIGYFTPRPVLFSLALFGIFLVVADRPNLRWTLPLLMWMWASIHGGFVVGLGLLVLDGLMRRDRRRIGDIAAATVASLFTAHGWGVWEIILKFADSREALDLIVEWLPPDFTGMALFPFLMGIVALLVGAMRGRLIPRDLWIVIPFLVFAFTANRAVPISALALAPFFVRSVAPSPSSVSTASARQSVVNAAIALAVILIPSLIPLSGGLDEELFAVDAIEHLAPGPAFHDDAVGGYLIYAKWPERQVYIDDRAELYGETSVDFVRARAGQSEWQRVFMEFEIHQALLKIEDPLTQVLAASGWTERFRDETFVVLTNSGG